MKTNGKDLSVEKDWTTNPRWKGITRPYTAQHVERLRGSLHIEYTLARHGAERLWDLLHSEKYVPSLGAMTGNQAIQQVKAGLPAIYVSGWQVGWSEDRELVTIPPPVRFESWYPRGPD